MLKKAIKKAFNMCGLEIHHLNPATDSETQLLAAINQKKIDLIFDIGANIGQFSSGIRNKGFKGRIVSFEPLSDARKQLLKNSSDDKNWLVHDQVAIGDQSGFIEINIAGNSVSSSVLPMLESHATAASGSAYISKEKVSIVPLDSIAHLYIDSSSSLFIKIDTQGYEWQVLNGATETLKRAKGILCELSLVPLYDGQHLWKEIIMRLEAEGFVLWAIQKGFIDPHDGRTLQIDAIFLR